jgi:xanthine/uracil permease
MAQANPRFQHALAMLAGIVTPPLILGGAGGANLDADTQQYLISASLIVCGILSAIQITRFHIYKTPYYIGTGLIRFGTGEIQWLIAVSSGHPSLQFLSHPLLLVSGMQTALVLSTGLATDCLALKVTERFWALHVSVHFLRLP